MDSKVLQALEEFLHNLLYFKRDLSEGDTPFEAPKVVKFFLEEPIDQVLLLEHELKSLILTFLPGKYIQGFLRILEALVKRNLISEAVDLYEATGGSQHYKDHLYDLTEIDYVYDSSEKEPLRKILNLLDELSSSRLERPVERTFSPEDSEFLDALVEFEHQFLEVIWDQRQIKWEDEGGNFFTPEVHVFEIPRVLRYLASAPLGRVRSFGREVKRLFESYYKSDPLPGFLVFLKALLDRQEVSLARDLYKRTRKNTNYLENLYNEAIYEKKDRKGLQKVLNLLN